MINRQEYIGPLVHFSTRMILLLEIAVENHKGLPLCKVFYYTDSSVNLFASIMHTRNTKKKKNSAGSQGKKTLSFLYIPCL